MRKVSCNEELEREILELKAKKEIDFLDLKLQLAVSYEELRPSRIVKRVFVDLKEEPELKNNLLQSVLSLGAGYITKRILIGKSNSFFKSMIGYIVQIGATKLISNKVITNDNK